MPTAVTGDTTLTFALTGALARDAIAFSGAIPTTWSFVSAGSPGPRVLVVGGVSIGITFAAGAYAPFVARRSAGVALAGGVRDTPGGAVRPSVTTAGTYPSETTYPSATTYPGAAVSSGKRRPTT